jgi:hypothetical protein
MLLKALHSKLRHEIGPFTIITNLPSRAIPNHWDHGYGPLACFDESMTDGGPCWCRSIGWRLVHRVVGRRLLLRKVGTLADAYRDFAPAASRVSAALST